MFQAFVAYGSMDLETRLTHAAARASDDRLVIGAGSCGHHVAAWGKTAPDPIAADDEGALEGGASKLGNTAERATDADLDQDGGGGRRDPRNNHSTRGGRVVRPGRTHPSMRTSGRKSKQEEGERNVEYDADR